MKTIGERIREGLEMRGLRQTDLIEKTGINKGALSCYISGRYEPKQNNIYLIARALDVNEAWLMGYDVPMERAASHNAQTYYINEETAQVAQEIYENKELRALFDVQKDMEPDDLRALHNMALALKRKERGDDDGGC